MKRELEGLAFLRQTAVVVVENTDEEVVALEARIVFAFAFDGDAEKARRMKLYGIAQVDCEPQCIEAWAQVRTGRGYTYCQENPYPTAPMP